jgi:D-beta-D-heptose 7-phosphate kinase/D-beta-D-heptose 1-phosphate adenosyltransferase
MKNKNILVIGDSILDRQVFCNAIGLSLETPTLKTALKKEEFCFGGAANVVNNLLSLGAKVTYITPVAEDAFSVHYENWNSSSLTLETLSYSGENVVKSRYWVSKGERSYKYLQINQGTKFENNPLLMDSVGALVGNNFEAAVLIDYRGGLFSDGAEVQELISKLRSEKITVYAASQTSDRSSQHKMFKGADLICLNASEAQAVVQTFQPTPSEIAKLSAALNARVCITLGADGSMLQTPTEMITEPAISVTAVDACGAGDSFLAALVASGEDLAFSNKWAAATTQQIGNRPPTLDEVSW